jgi:very-short-patch-repair endonuclease
VCQAPAVVRGGGTLERVRQETPDSQGFLAARGDEAVAALAARQHAVVSIAQLRAAGLGAGAIEYRVLRRRLVRLHRGVYAVGHARLTQRGRLWAAVLAWGGEQAVVVSHRSAAALWDLAPPPSSTVEVTTRRHSRPTPAVRVYRTSSLHPRDVHRDDDGLPRTTVARTLLDLATVLSPTRLQRACHQAEHQRILDMTAIAHVLERAGTGRGTRKLRDALNQLAATGPQPTRSELEVRFLSLIAHARLPMPRVNARVAGLEVDFHWPAHRLVVETDGAATHLTPTSFETVRRRDATLQIAGLRVVRITWRQLTDRPHTVEHTLRALLGKHAR